MEKLGCPDNLPGQWMAFYGYLVYMIPHLLWTSTGNLSQGFFHQFSWGSWLDLFTTKLTMVRAFWPANAFPDWKLSTCSVWNEAPKRSRGSSGFMMICLWWKGGNGCSSQCWHKPRPIFSQPKQLPWLYHTCCGHAYDMHMIIITTLKRLQTLAYTSSPVFSPSSFCSWWGLLLHGLLCTSHPAQQGNYIFIYL